MPKSRENDSMSVSYADSVQLLFETQDGWYSYARDGEYGEDALPKKMISFAFDGHSGMKITLLRNGVALKDGKNTPV